MLKLEIFLRLTVNYIYIYIYIYIYVFAVLLSIFLDYCFVLTKKHSVFIVSIFTEILFWGGVTVQKSLN